MSTIYLDNNATTPIDRRVLEELYRSLEEEYGNASSVHALGTRADSLLEEARESIAADAGVTSDWVVFTSGGTEGNNAALKGLFRANRNRGSHIVTSAIEHTSDLEPIRQLEREGAEVTRVQPNRDGLVSAEEVARAVGDETVIVSVMQVNNETGAVQPIRGIAEAVRKRNARTLLHVDGVQAFGKTDVAAALVDAYTVSAHKLHGPKGVGVLFLRPGARFDPLLAGGGHERGVRSGTENVPGARAFALASRIARNELPSVRARLEKLKERLESALSEFEGVEILSGRPGVANTVMAAFPPIPGEIIVNALSDRGIFVSTGAACSSRRNKRSHVLGPILKERGRPEELSDSSVRISLSRFTTEEEIETTIRTMEEELPRLRRAALRSVS